jgi:pyridoxine 5-phosphate synthase
MPLLGVNVDHVATLRQARRTAYPDPVEAALSAQRAGARAITVHLREDRRHIQDEDLVLIRNAIGIHLNQEMAPIDEMVEIALRVRPDEACLVPERREELTTEGGLEVVALRERLGPIVGRLKAAGIAVSLFVEPREEQLRAAAELGADYVELHTGAYALAADRQQAAGAKSPAAARAARELERIRASVAAARSLGLKVNAGHGLNYANAAAVARIPGLSWLHIGHAIVARALAVGLARAVREMCDLIGACGREKRAARRAGGVRR